MKRILLLFTALIIALPSCASGRAAPRDIISYLCKSEADLPAGMTYSTDALEGSPEFLRPELLAATYGIPLDFGGIESAAIRLSGTYHPCEFAIFLCKDTNAVEDVALFCKQRIKDLNQNALYASALCGMSKEEYKEYISGALVTISGRYVALIISSDPSHARRAFLKAL